MKKKHFRDHCIPTQSNNYKPHFLRKESLLSLIIVVIVLEVALFAHLFVVLKGSNFLAAVLPGVLVSLTNEERSILNLQNLKTNPLLEQAAQLKANDMASKGYFSHTSPEGVEPWHWLNTVGYQYVFAGENLAVNFIESTDVSKAWMNSPSHRDNIVSSKYTEIGIATAQGIYKGQNTTFVVQFFGTPQFIPGPQPISPRQVFAEEKPSLKPAPVLEPEVESAQEVALDPTPVPATPVNAQEVAERSENNSLDRTLSSPKQTVSLILLGLLAILIILTLAAIFIEIKVQHPKTIAASIAVMLILAGTLYMNNKVVVADVELPSDSQNASSFLSF